MRNIIYNFILGFNVFILFYVIIISIWQILQLFSALYMIYSNRRREHLLSMDVFDASPELIPISIIAPAYNEGTVIVDSVKGMLNLNYPDYEVVVVNDGSSDDSLEKLIKEFDLHRIAFPVQIKVPCATIRGVYRSSKHPNLMVVDKENGGKKADACNAGINVSRYPYFLNMDSDCLLDPDALRWVARSFMSNSNCVAVGGMMRMSNGNRIKDHQVTDFRMPKKWLPRFQVMEYGRSFLVGRLFTGSIGCLMVISGAFGAFHKESVVEVGGYSLDSSGEDMDLVMKLHRLMREKKQKYRIVFSPRAICWTQGPEKYKDLRGQRRRWQAGLVQVLVKFRRLLFNPKYGTVGFVGMPYQVLYEMCGPVIEVMGLLVMPLALYFGIITVQGFLTFTTAAILLGILLSVGSLLADIGVFNRSIKWKDFFLMFFLCLFDTIVFRLLTLWFRIQAIFGYSKFQHRWETITRQSFEDTSEEQEDETIEKPSKTASKK